MSEKVGAEFIPTQAAGVTSQDGRYSHSGAEWSSLHQSQIFASELVEWHSVAPENSGPLHLGSLGGGPSSRLCA